MSLRGWQDNGWLTKHESSPEEVADYLVVVERDLQDAAVREVSADRRLGIGYSAARQLATLALAAEGYRPGRQRAHERAIQSLRFTIALPQDLVDTLDAVRRKRNVSDYEQAGTATNAEADEVYELAVDLRHRVLSWMKQEHPELLPL